MATSAAAENVVGEADNAETVAASLIVDRVAALWGMQQQCRVGGSMLGCTVGMATVWDGV